MVQLRSLSLLSTILSKYVHNGDDPTVLHTLARRASSNPRSPEFIVFACLIPVLVILSGVFAGLTLGYMSLDETQLNVLSISGTPQQKRYAAKIKPIRQNGHLLLVTLLLANMIVNESLPIISDPILGGGVQSVVVSTVLIVIFSEIIPQSLCTRHGLYLGAKMAGFTRVLIYLLGIVAWPVAKLLEFVLGPHHGIIYRRAELKELIAMHSSISAHGGDLKTDTVNIIGATLDLQEKVVKQAMTPIDDVFMLSIDSKLDYETLKKISLTGHSRVPVYEEVEIPVDSSGRMERGKKIIGILLVKHCIMLDPGDAVPVRMLPLNKVPFVPNNEPLLGILDKFQEGRSHMAIVSRFSVEKAASVKKVAKQTLTQRLRQRVGISDSSSDSGESSDEEESRSRPTASTAEGKERSKGVAWADDSEKESTIQGDAITDLSDVGKSVRGSSINRVKSKKRRERPKIPDIEAGLAEETVEGDNPKDKQILRLPKSGTGLEQTMPADALLTKKDAKDFLQGIDPAIMPLGIITLEDVLEELIGEEIYDEFDFEAANGTISSFVPSEHANTHLMTEMSARIAPQITNVVAPTSPVLRPLNTRGLNFLRSKSAPPSPRRDRSPSLFSAPSQATQSNTSTGPTADIPPVPLTTAETPQVIVATASDGPRAKPEARMPRHSGVSSVSALASERVSDSSTPSRPTISPIRKCPASSSGPTSALVSMSPATSRTTSPAPSLEAVLLERKRRLVAAAAVGPVAVALSGLSSPVSSSGTGASGSANTVAAAVARSSAVTKGPSKFKSSPLGSGEPTTRVVIAEKVKRNIKGQGQPGQGQQQQGHEDVRIPTDEMDKAGSDKKEDDSGYL